MISLVAICKDELDVSCWIDYNLTIGFDNILIYDDFSKIPVTYYDPRVEIKLVDEEDRHTYVEKIIKYYDRGVRHFYHSDWVAFFDIDEYLVFDPQKELKDVLSEFSEYGAVMPHWRLFGSNGHVDKPEGRVFENFTMRAEDDFSPNWFMKVILQPQYCERFVNAHYAQCVKPSVDENHQVIMPGIYQESPANKLWLNHYFVKSKIHYINRLNRGSVDGLNRDWNTFDYHDMNEVLDLRAKELYDTKQAQSLR